MADQLLKDRKDKEVKVGSRLLIPCVVVEVAGSQSPLLHIETVDAYGHENPAVKTAMHGKTKTAMWVEPGQIEVAE